MQIASSTPRWKNLTSKELRDIIALEISYKNNNEKYPHSQRQVFFAFLCWGSLSVLL